MVLLLYMYDTSFLTVHYRPNGLVFCIMFWVRNEWLGGACEHEPLSEPLTNGVLLDYFSKEELRALQN